MLQKSGILHVHIKFAHAVYHHIPQFIRIIQAMPHKHKRDKLTPSSSYNLPPSQIAYPLPTTEKFAAQRKSLKRKSKPADDDTPRAFTRLLGPYQPPRSGLDDVTRPPKKSKTGAAKSTLYPQASLPPTHLEPAVDAPTRQHNESLSSFAARVDVELPFSRIQKKSMLVKGIDKGKQTRMERKMQKMYKGWREEDNRMREKAEELAARARNDDEEEVVMAMGVVAGPSKRKSKNRKWKHGNGELRSSDDEDPWYEFVYPKFILSSQYGSTKPRYFEQGIQNWPHVRSKRVV